jgi:hypothetical protein
MLSFQGRDPVLLGSRAPVLWFRKCESAFRHSNTTSSGVKFDHIVGKLPNTVSLSSRSLLLSINFEDKDAYERLKAHLCKNFGKTKWQLGYALLDSRRLLGRRSMLGHRRLLGRQRLLGR